MSKEVVQLNDGRYVYYYGVQVPTGDISSNAMHSKTGLDRSGKMAGHEAVKENDEEVLKKD